jgi:hypothetical protein
VRAAVQIARDSLKSDHNEGAATPENERLRHTSCHRRKTEKRQSKCKKKKRDLPHRSRQRQPERKFVCEALQQDFREDRTIHHQHYKEKLFDYQVPA